METEITTQVNASDIISLARKCIENINKHRENEDVEFITNFMKEYNHKWRKRWFRKARSLNSIDETRKYIKTWLKSRTIWDSYCPYPSYAGYETEQWANKVIKHFDNTTNANSVYTINIEIHTNIAKWANK